MAYFASPRTRLALLVPVLLLFNGGHLAGAQGVGVGTATPDASAALDVTAPNKGLLVPRVVLSGTTAPAPLTLPATGLLVYNTNAAMPGPCCFTAWPWPGRAQGPSARGFCR